MTLRMCPPPQATWYERLRHAWSNSYYRYATAYLLVINTVIMVEVILGNHHG